MCRDKVSYKRITLNWSRQPILSTTIILFMKENGNASNCSNIFMALFFREVSLTEFHVDTSPPIHSSSCWMANCKSLSKPIILPFDNNFPNKNSNYKSTSVPHHNWFPIKLKWRL